MYPGSHRSALAVVCGLTCATLASAQPVPTFDPPSNLPVQPSDLLGMELGRTRLPDRRPSPVETLTGEREPSVGQGREANEMETDRDAFTPATSTAGRRRLIVESAYTFTDNRGFKDSHSVPELVLRYGLTDRVELRLGWNQEVGGERNEALLPGEESVDRVNRSIREFTLSYGVKIGLTTQDKWLPRSALILAGFTPTGGESTATQLVATYAAGWELPNRWRFDAAMRYGTASEGGDHFNKWSPSAVLRVPLGERWAVHGEYFGIITAGKAQNETAHYFSPGARWLATPDLEIGIRLGWGLTDQSARFFANTGFGYRF